MRRDTEIREGPHEERLCLTSPTGAGRTPFTLRVSIRMGLMYFPVLNVRHQPVGRSVAPPHPLLPSTPGTGAWPAIGRLGSGTVADWRLPARATEFKEGAGTRCPAALQSPPGAPVPAARCRSRARRLSLSTRSQRLARAGEDKPREGSVQAGAGGTVLVGRTVWTSLRPPW